MAQPTERAGSPAARKRDNREIARLVVFGIGLVLLIAFVIGNSNPVKVNFVFFHTRTSLVWVILLSAVLGLLVDRLIIALGKRRKKQKQ
ncbi:MAG TPA: LapA family protein [Acidimicrobiales bacterium]